MLVPPTHPTFKLKRLPPPHKHASCFSISMKARPSPKAWPSLKTWPSPKTRPSPKAWPSLGLQCSPAHRGLPASLKSQPECRLQGDVSPEYHRTGPAPPPISGILSGPPSRCAEAFCGLLHLLSYTELFKQRDRPHLFRVLQAPAPLCQLSEEWRT